MLFYLIWLSIFNSFRLTLIIYNMEKQVFRQNNYILSSVITSKCMKLIIRLFNKSDFGEFYQGYLPSIQEDQIMSQYFQNLGEVQDYIKDRDNIEVDTQTLVVKLVSQVNTKKRKKISICTLQLLPVKRGVKDTFSQIIKSCSIDKELSNDFIKISIKSISECLCEFLSVKQKQVQKLKNQEQAYKNELNINSEIQHMKEKIENLLKEEEQNRTYIENYHKLSEQKSQKIEQKMKEMQFKQGEQYSKICEQVSELGNKMSEQLYEKVQELSTLFTRSQETQTIIKKLKILSKSMEEILEQLQFEQLLKSISQLNDFENHKNQKVIEYIGTDKKWTKYIFDKLIPYNQKYTFKLKIINTVSNLMIGIVDDKNRFSINGNKQIIQFGNFKSTKGQKCVARIQNQDGFQAGDVVKVVVRLNEKKIYWYVNNVKQAEYVNDILGDRRASYMPIVRFFHKNSSVQWLDN